MYRSILFLIYIFFLISISYSQPPIPIVNENYRVDWSNAGLQYTLPIAADHLFDVTDYGAIPDDSGLDLVAINNAIAAAKSEEGLSIIYFPMGTYKINNTIKLELEKDPVTGNITFDGNIIFQGEGSDKTFLEFDLLGNQDDKPCFEFIGEIENPSSPLALSQNINRHSATFNQNISSVANNSDWIHLN